MLAKNKVPYYSWELLEAEDLPIKETVDDYADEDEDSEVYFAYKDYPWSIL